MKIRLIFKLKLTEYAEILLRIENLKIDDKIIE